MSLIKTNLEKTPTFRSLLSDLFHADTFFDSELLAKSLFSKTPAANVKEDERSFEIELAVPGLSKENIRINLDNEVLEISTEQKSEKTEDNKTFSRKEFSYSSFSRSFDLPESIRKDEIKADYKDGILKIVLPKKEEAKINSKKEIKLS